MIKPMTSKQITTGIITLKHAYRIMLHGQRMVSDEIRYCRRQIKLTQHDPFFKHRRMVWQSRIDELQDFLIEKRPLMHQIQELLIEGIRMFDVYGPAPVHVYAALLSTHHTHIERALAEGATNLMELIIYKVEDGASTADWISEDAVLHDAVTRVVIREICRNSEFKRKADSLIQKMVQDSLGRPLQQYQITKLPNGQTVIKPMPPNLQLVRKH